MKIRHGFVSNSSSSSFIILVPCDENKSSIDSGVYDILSIDALDIEDYESDEYKEINGRYIPTEYIQYINKFEEMKDKGYSLISIDVEYGSDESLAKFISTYNKFNENKPIIQLDYEEY